MKVLSTINGCEISTIGIGSKFLLNYLDPKERYETLELGREEVLLIKAVNPKKKNKTKYALIMYKK